MDLFGNKCLHRGMSKINSTQKVTSNGDWTWDLVIHTCAFQTELTWSLKSQSHQQWQVSSVKINRFNIPTGSNLLAASILLFQMCQLCIITEKLYRTITHFDLLVWFVKFDVDSIYCDRSQLLSNTALMFCIFKGNKLMSLPQKVLARTSSGSWLSCNLLIQVSD